MADVHDLKAVLKDTLEKRGVIGQLKARVRAEVFEALDDRSEPRPPLSHENLLINELIREYLEFNKYKYTASVLSAESGLSEIPLDRSFLARELNIVEDSNSQSVPVLYGILSHFLKGSDYNGHCHNIQSAPTDRLRLGRFNVPDTHQEPARVTQTIIKGSNPLHRMNT